MCSGQVDETTDRKEREKTNYVPHIYEFLKNQGQIGVKEPHENGQHLENVSNPREREIPSPS